MRHSLPVDSDASGNPTKILPIVYFVVSSSRFVSGRISLDTSPVGRAERGVSIG
jgi:hypothetical protein